MAFGFGSRGGGASDKIQSGLTASSTLNTYSFFCSRAGEGGAGTGRMFDRATATDEVIYNFDTSKYAYGRLWSGGFAIWTFVRPSTAMHHLVVTYDAGSSSNLPTARIDGSTVTVSVSVGASGSDAAGTSGYVIGNRNANDRNWDGDIAEWAKWNVILNADEQTALAKGMSPLLIRPQSLVEYLPMNNNPAVSSPYSYIVPLTGYSGVARQQHPGIIMPTSGWVISAAAPPGVAYVLDPLMTGGSF